MTTRWNRTTGARMVQTVPTALELVLDGGVVQLVEDAALRAQLITNGRENVAHYSWKKTADQLAGVLVRASGEGRA